jgi:hypothetical protein
MNHNWINTCILYGYMYKYITQKVLLWPVSYVTHYKHTKVFEATHQTFLVFEIYIEVDRLIL